MSTLTVTLIQASLAWEDKISNLRHFEEKINSISQRTELVILPEMFNTGFSMRPQVLAETMQGETVQWMKRIAHEKKIILAGSLIIEEDGHYFNRLIWMLPNGQTGIYDKRHRFGYGGEDLQFSAGHKRLVASVNGWRVNLMICYDLRFPVWARQSPRREPPTNGESGLEYDLLVYVANWPEKRSTAWKTLLQARAIENQSFVVGVNRIGKDGHGIEHIGDSMVVGPLGEILYYADNKEDTYSITLNKADLTAVREKLPFWKDADPFLLLQDEEE